MGIRLDGLRMVRRLFCRHDLRFVRNIYGDEINLLNGKSLWVCEKCGADMVPRELHTSNADAESSARSEA